jgi:cyclopropane-fatty-acyl-phospholipid synthase
MVKKVQDLAQKLLFPAGIIIDGDNPWDIKVNDERMFSRVFGEGNLGSGESYMDGWWDCGRLDEFFYKILYYRVDEKLIWNWPFIREAILSKLFNRQAGKKAFVIGEKHYDTGNDLFGPMLGKTMAYSCGYWSSPAGEAKNLDEAQEAKFDLICRKLGLEPGMTLLDIGCGWGGFMKYAAERYGAKATGITVSKEQVGFGRELCKGLPVEIRLQDYRSLNEKFDRIASVGMIEHVGYKNYREYMRVAKRCLKKSGIFLLHTIGGEASSGFSDPWIEKYIFPNSHLPSLKQLMKAVEGIFVVEDIHNFGSDYDGTLMAWYRNFENSWPSLEKKYGERFRRMWRYYLLSCAGMFRARRANLWQIVLSKDGVPGGWKSVR